jgi:alpha-tubulin suppressor-like RCC1 family protein
MTVRPTTTAQTFCGPATVANLVATGTAIQWYAALTGGVALAPTTALVSGTTYYASQTIGGVESARVGALVTITPIPFVTFISNKDTVCAGASATLTATGASSYTWMPGSLTGSSISVSPNSTTAYSVTGSAGACSNVVGTTGGFKSISAGQSHTVGIKTDGTLWAWGHNYFGQLGDGSTTTSYTPVQIGTDTWASISAGNAHTVGIKTDGTLWAWGYNSNGQLGDGSGAYNKTTPVKIGTAKWTSISAGDSHTVGIKTDGTLWAWGYNSNGQLGDNSIINKTTPVPIGTSKWASVSAGGSHTLGIKTDGTLWAWGNNYSGQLGDGSNSTKKTTPTQIGTAWASISAGYAHSIGIKTDGTLWAWGSNSTGQLGDNSIINKTTPVKIGTDTWVGISTGQLHTMGIKTDGTLWAWGRNGYGQLGDDSTLDKKTPVSIGTATWVSIDAGVYYTMGIKTDGTLWAWGRNNYGQLGDGFIADKASPVQIGTASSTLAIVVNPILTPSVSTAITTGSQTICAGTSVTFTATPTNGGTPTYQWKKGGVNISGATNATFTSMTLANNDAISVEMTSSATCASPTTATSAATFMTINPLPTATISGTTMACTSVSLTASGGTSYAWSGGTTPSVSANTFTTSNDYSVTVTDANGCDGTATKSVTVVNCNDIHTGSTSCETATLTNVQGNSWFNFISPSGIIASLNPNGMDLGTVTVEVSDASGAVTFNGKKFLGRSVNFMSSNYASGVTMPNNYSLRLYYMDSELTEYNSATSGSYTLPDFSMMWEEGGTGCSLPTYGGTLEGMVGKATVVEAEYGTGDNGFYLQLPLNHFTIFAATTSTNTVLPIELVSFNGYAKNNNNILAWRTEAEQNFSHFELQHGLNGIDFETMSQIKAKGQGSEYGFTHQNPTAATHYYRLKMVDNDGTFKFSQVISLNKNETKSLKVYPNPTKNTINIMTSDYAQPMRLYSINGALLMSKNQTVEQLDISALPTGMYFLHVGSDVLKVIKE